MTSFNPQQDKLTSPFSGRGLQGSEKFSDLLSITRESKTRHNVTDPLLPYPVVENPEILRVLLLMIKWAILTESAAATVPC